MKYLLWLFIPILLLGQVKTVTQTGVKRSMIRGDATTLTWTVSGDYSSDSLLFIAMDNDSNAVLRLTTSGGLTASYSSPNTTITGTIHAATTENFIAQNYLYDISSVTDSVTLIMGLLSVIADVSNLEDTVLASVPYYTVALDTPAANNNFIVGMDSTNRWYQKTLAQTRTILGIDTITGAANLPDSVVYDSQISDMVTKSTSQTITGQKNFMGTVKFRSDTSIIVGGTIGSYALGLDYYLKTANSYQIPLRFNALDSNTPAWTITSGEVDFTPSVLGKDHVFNIGNNWSSTHSRPQFGQQMESQYEMNDTTLIHEWFSYYNDLPPPNMVYSVRPFQVGTFRYGSSAPYKYSSRFATNTDDFWILDERNVSLIEFRTQTYGATADEQTINRGRLQDAYGNSMMYILDSLWIFHGINNMGWLYQATNNGSSRELLRIDDQNRLLLAPSTDTPIKFGSPIYGAIYWTDEAGTGNIPINKETGTDRIHIGVDDGMVTNKLEVTSIPQDTTGLEASQFYIDNLTGSVQYTMPENIFADGTFTSWTGVNKARVPVNWYYNDIADTIGTYVEENPAGQLHFISDGTRPTASIISYDSSTVGMTYGYSFTVTQISDTVRFYIADESAYLLSSIGVYTGVSDEITTSRNLVALHGSDDASASEATLDNIRIWEIGGNIETPTYDVPVILDSLGLAIAPVIDTTGVTDGYVLKYVSGQIVYSPDISTSGSGTFNPDGITIDTTAGGLARVLPAKVTKWDSVSFKQNRDTDLENPDLALNLVQDSLDVKANRSELGTGAYATIANYSLTSHTHTEFFDTLSFNINIADTVITGDNAIWKVPNNITIIEVAFFTNTGTVTGNLEERGETTPNTAGTDVMTSDLTGDTDQQESTTFSNAGIAKDAWLALVIASKTGNPTLFGANIRYVKTN